MRFHIFHEASSDHLLISDSQTHSVRNNTTIAFGVVNVLTLPGGQIRHLYDFLPKPGQYKLVTLFIGGNDSYLRGGNVSNTPAQEIANELKTLADILSDRTEEVYVIGIPERYKKPQCAKSVNDLLSGINRNAHWKCRSVSKYLWSIHILEDGVHLSSDGLKNLKKLFKEKMLYKSYNVDKDNEGPKSVFSCGSREQPLCICGHLNR